MKHVSSSGALARRSREMLQLAFVVVTAGVFAAVVGLMLFVVPLAVPSNQIYPFYNFVRNALLFGGALVGLVGLGLALRAYFTRIDNDLAKVVGQYLEGYLNDDYWFIRNINKRGLGYIDAVLVGPPGALVFRILDATGVYANERADWLRQKPGDEWVPARIDPTREDIVDIEALRKYLAQNDLYDIPVYGVVVFTKSEPVVKLMLKEPTVPVTHLGGLLDSVRASYGARERITTPVVQAIVDLIYDQ